MTARDLPYLQHVLDACSDSYDNACDDYAAFASAFTFGRFFCRACQRS